MIGKSVSFTWGVWGYAPRQRMTGTIIGETSREYIVSAQGLKSPKPIHKADVTFIEGAAISAAEAAPTAA